MKARQRFPPKSTFQQKKMGFLLKGLAGFSGEQFLLSVEIFSFKKPTLKCFLKTLNIDVGYAH